MYCISNRRCRGQYFGAMSIKQAMPAALKTSSQNQGESVIGGLEDTVVELGMEIRFEQKTPVSYQ
jgi:hypothetical protein